VSHPPPAEGAGRGRRREQEEKLAGRLRSYHNVASPSSDAVKMRAAAAGVTAVKMLARQTRSKRARWASGHSPGSPRKMGRGPTVK